MWGTRCTSGTPGLVTADAHCGCCPGCATAATLTLLCANYTLGLKTFLPLNCVPYCCGCSRTVCAETGPPSPVDVHPGSCCDLVYAGGGQHCLENWGFPSRRWHAGQHLPQSIFFPQPFNQWHAENSHTVETSSCSAFNLAQNFTSCHTCLHQSRQRSRNTGLDSAPEVHLGHTANSSLLRCPGLGWEQHYSSSSTKQDSRDQTVI